MADEETILETGAEATVEVESRGERFAPDEPDLFGRGEQGSSVSAADLPPEAVPAETDAPAEAEGAAANLAAEAQQSWQSIREAAEQRLGYKFPATVTDDQAALNYLIHQAQAAKQADVYSQVGRQIAPHAGEFQAFLAERQKAAAPQPSPWDKPQWDARWAALIEIDPATGMATGKPGAPPEIVTAANKTIEWRRRVEEDPEGYQEHLFEKRFAPKVQEMIARERGQMTQEAVVSDILRSNAQWLYLRDEAGQISYDHQGSPALSPAGARYSQLLSEAAQDGIADPRRRDAYAKRILSLEAQAAAQGQAAVKAKQAASPQTRQAAAQPNRNAAGTRPAAQRRTDPAATEPSSAGLTLRDMMRAEFARSGITDDDVADFSGN